jgi:hypothetical protein
MMGRSSNYAFEPAAGRQFRPVAGALRESAPAARTRRSFAAAQRER